MTSAPITPKLIDVCPAYREALDDYVKTSVAWAMNPTPEGAWEMDMAWLGVTQAASAFRRLKAVE